MILQIRGNSANQQLLQSYVQSKQPQTSQTSYIIRQNSHVVEQNIGTTYRTLSPSKTITQQDLITINKNNQILTQSALKTINIGNINTSNQLKQIVQYSVAQPQNQILNKNITKKIVARYAIASTQNTQILQSSPQKQIINQKITVLQQPAPQQVIFRFNQQKKYIVRPVIYQSRRVLVQYPADQTKPQSEVNFLNMKIEPKRKLIHEYNLQSNPLSLRSPIRKIQENYTLAEAKEEYEQDPEDIPMRALDQQQKPSLKRLRNLRPNKFKRNKKDKDDDLERRFNEAVKRSRAHRPNEQGTRSSQNRSQNQQIEDLALQYGDGYFYSGQGIPPQTRHGFGILTDPSGNELYSGRWKNNLYHGEGKLSNINPEELQQPLNYNDLSEFQQYWTAYEGQFSEGLIEGHGVIYFSNGERYEGEFVDGMIEGKGKFFFKDQSYFDGYWQTGILVQS